MRKNSRRPFSGKLLLELLAAAFILLGPTVLGAAVGSWGLYAVFAVTAAVFAARLFETGRIHLSVNIAVGGVMLAYALFVLIWADDRAGHLRLCFVLLTVLLTAMLAADYFAQEKDIGSRLTGLVLISALICGAWNILDWIIIRRFSLDGAFAAGLGDRHLVGMFMLAGLWCCQAVLRGKNGKLKPSAFVAGLPLLFVLVMSRSLLTALAGGIFLVFVSLGRRNLAACVSGAAVSALSAAAMIIMAVRGSGGGLRPFADGVLCGLKNIGGLGGGGFLLRQGEFQSVYYDAASAGLGAELVSSLGLPGGLAFLAAVAWTVHMAVKKKSLFCGFGGAIAVFAFLTGAEHSLGALMMLAGVLAYGEWRQGRTLSVRIRPVRFVVAGILGALAVFGCVLGVSAGIKARGIETGSGGALALAARLDPFDGDCCYRAALAYHESYGESGSRNDLAYAEYYIQEAIDRGCETGPYLAEYAEIEALGGKLASAVDTDAKAMELSPLWEDAKVRAAGHLYSLIETTQKGSVAANRCYQRILELAEAVDNMERKKLITDYADRAQPYIRMDFGYGEDEELEIRNEE